MQRVRTSEDPFGARLVALLSEAGRPLNVRRIASLGAERGVFDDLEAAEAEVRRRLDSGLPPGIRQVRPGVLAWSDVDAAEVVEAQDTSAPVQTSGGDDEEDADERAGRRRRRRMVDLLGSGPAAAPVSLDEAVAAAEAAGHDPEAAHARLWAGLRARAAALIGAMPDDRPGRSVSAGPAPSSASTRRPEAHRPARVAAATTPVAAATTPVVAATTPAAAATTPPESESPAPVAADPTRDRLKARLRSRKPLVAEAETIPPPGLPTVAALDPTPYLERRQTAEPPPEAVERRTPTLPEAEFAGVAAEVLVLLRSRGERISLTGLAVALDYDDSLASLRALLRAENARQVQSGLRAPFTWPNETDVGLSEWGLPARYLDLERTLGATLAEMREVARRELLARVVACTDEVFEQIVLEVLGRAGLEELAPVHRQAGGTLALLGRHRTLGDAPTAVLARRSTGVIGAATLEALRGALADFGATHGVVLTCGTFDDAARSSAARMEHGPLTLVDGHGLARLLYAHGVGTRTHAPVLRVPDPSFFDAP
jgi:hypothetical protein